MGVVADILLAIAPELDTESPRRIKTFIDLAEDQVGTVFGSRRDLAVAYMTAHMITVANRLGKGGAITSESEGELSRSYQQAGDGTDPIMSTSYGQEFKRMSRAAVFSPRNRMVRYG